MCKRFDNPGMQKGYEEGIKDMKRKMLSVCDTDKPIEIDGKAYFVQSDIKHLHKLFDDIEKNANKKG